MRERRLDQPVDLRSDTVTKPTPEMRRAMAEAEVGDDVYGEDPTVNRLEARAADIFEREAALFVPSGSMGNLIAIRIHCDHGNEVICESRGHIYNFEMAALAAIAGCLARPVHAEDGILTWKHIEPAIRPQVYYRAQTGLISLENTHNVAGGVVLPPAVQEEICGQAHARGLPVHLDGARIFNAATALGKSVAELTRNVDSIMFCLSKGLGAPVGSMLVGSRAFIDKARVYRKMFGGGMRQAGVLAAAGLVALEKSPPLLLRDHQNARTLAEGLAALPGIKLDPKTVETNILIFDVSGTGLTSQEISARLKDHDVLANGIDPKTMRMVTHYDVDAAGIERALSAMRG
ncbi:MAG: aminotransferase class I/II-fold pyridoxal phosphate-dependent enzyme, partial [Acidobacteria bacterium]|nr:aminotransferase class I/II-fold pyridoxal phosphate-dependent enzyme [Acidobacteriota bacterium]